MKRRNFIAALLSIPLGMLAKRLLRANKALSGRLFGKHKQSCHFFYIFADPNEVSEIPLPTGETVYLYKSDLRRALAANPYPLTIADGEAYQRDLKKHGKQPWRFGNV